MTLITVEEYIQPRSRFELSKGDLVRHIEGECGTVIESSSSWNTIELNTGETTIIDQFNPDWQWFDKEAIETSWGERFDTVEDLEDAINNTYTDVSILEDEVYDLTNDLRGKEEDLEELEELLHFTKSNRH